MKNDIKFAINIGRQLGSGGRLIAKGLSEALGIKFYDKELLDLAARESGFCKELFERNDEQKRWLGSPITTHIPFMGDDIWYNNQLSCESLFKFQSDAIRKVAKEESAVFVGRCADYILRDHPHSINIFIWAEIEERIKHISEDLQVDLHQARKIVERGDARRTSYYNYFCDKTWGAAESYHMSINSTLLGVDGTMTLLKDFVERTLNR